MNPTLYMRRTEWLVILAKHMYCDVTLAHTGVVVSSQSSALSISLFISQN